MNRSTRSVFPAFTAIPVLFTAGIIAAASAASAGNSFDVPAWGEARSATVYYADLDLTTPAGTDRLKRRIAYAIEKVCALPNAEQLSQRSQAAACKAEARSQADARLARLQQRSDSVARRD